MTIPNIYCFIPCNLDSKRLPNKPLLEKNGKTVLEHTYELASQIRCLKRPPIVLFDDVSVYNRLKHVLKRIPNYDEINGMTTGKLENGTLRCAYAAQSNIFDVQDNDIIINVQVDEVEFNPEIISQKLLKYIDNNWELGTFAYNKIEGIDYTCNHVKVDTNLHGFATYFSRKNIFGAVHVGIYIYRVFTLKLYEHLYKFSKLSIEKENLEQMLFFDLGKKFAVLNHESPTFSINTQEDYDEWLQR